MSRLRLTRSIPRGTRWNEFHLDLDDGEDGPRIPFTSLMPGDIVALQAHVAGDDNLLGYILKNVVVLQQCEIL